MSQWGRRILFNCYCCTANANEEVGSKLDEVAGSVCLVESADYSSCRFERRIATTVMVKCQCSWLSQSLRLSRCFQPGAVVSKNKCRVRKRRTLTLRTNNEG